MCVVLDAIAEVDSDGPKVGFSSFHFRLFDWWEIVFPSLFQEGKGC